MLRAGRRLLTRRLLASSLLAALPAGNGLAQERFFNLYDSIRVDRINSFVAVIETSAGGFAISGNNENTAFLLKVDPTGATVFAKTYDPISSTHALDEDGGGFVLVGCRGNGDSALLRVDASGDPIWSATYHPQDVEACFSAVHPTPDGAYLVSGKSTVKLDPAGNVLWTRSHAGPGRIGAFRSMELTADGGSIHAGAAGYLAVTRMDANGAIQWNKYYASNAEYNVANDVKPTSDGGYIVTGTIGAFGAGTRACFLLKTDAGGELEWATTYSGASESRCHGVAQTSDGGYAMTGTLDGSLMLAKTNPAGAIEWVRTYGGGATGYSLRTTSDGGYVVAGVSAAQALTLLKTDAAGDALSCSLANPGPVVAATSFVTSPNTINEPRTWTWATLSPATSALALQAQSPCHPCTAIASGQASPDVACSGTTVDLASNGSNVTGCNRAVEYRFSGTNGFVRDWGPAPAATDTPAATTTYTVEIRCTDPGCQATSAGFTVTIDPLPTADAGPSPPICDTGPVAIGGTPAALGGTPPYDYTWTAVPLDPTMSCTGGPACANPIVNPAVTTTYRLRVDDSRGCSAEDQAVVSRIVRAPPPDVGNTLATIKDWNGIPPGPTSMVFAWQDQGGAAAVYNLRRSDNRNFTPSGIVQSVAPGAGARLAGEVLTTPALRLYRITTSNCAGVESPI